MKRVLIAAVVFLFAQYGFGQDMKLRALKVGDTLPDVALKMLQYKDSILNTRNIGSKLTILGFWTPQCTFSSSQVAVMQELQEEFPRDLFLLPVGFDAHEEGAVAKYIRDEKETGGQVKMPVAVQGVTDSLMFTLFPFMGVPHYVWLNSSHVIIGVTDYLSVTEKNLSDLLTGKPVALPLKYTDRCFDAEKPLLVNDNGGADSAFVYRSLLMPYNPGISLPLETNRTEAYTRIATGNRSPLTLITEAIYGINKGNGRLPYDPLHKRIVNKTTNRTGFEKEWSSYPRSEYAKAEEIRKQQSFSYEVILPPQYSLEDAYRKMLDDVSSFFKVKATVQVMTIPGLALVVQKGKALPPSKKEPESVYVSDDYLTYRFENCTVATLAGYFNSCLDMPLIADQTHSTERVSLSFRLPDKSDITSLANCLHKAGLTVTRTAINEDMLVIENR